MTFKWNPEGLRQLDELIAKAAPGRVPVDEILTPAFMREHTNVGSFDEMFNASGLSRENLNGLAKSDDWNRFVAARTKYASFDDMLREAYAHGDSNDDSPV